VTDIPIIDRRGGRTASGLQVGNLDQTMRNLRSAGHTLPNNPVMARAEAQNIQTAVNNRTLTDAMRKERAAAGRATMGGQRSGMMRQAADMQIALPKTRTPMGTLQDMGIPTNVDDVGELTEIRRWARLFYTCHDLVPLLIDIYSKFPVVGLEFDSKDSLIKDFYTRMFMDELNYAEFLPDVLGREYWICGEVNSLAHFNESLGIWSSEEVLNPDQLRVSRSMFVQRERVQIMFKDLVDTLRNGPKGTDHGKESPSERAQRMWEYEQLAANYPEIIEAAQQDDGLDISDALLSRIVNRSTPWATRGTPHLLRSFRTLMSEESLNAAQNAVADRLYSPLILATVGVPDLGDGEPWIPEQSDLDDVRDDMQNALAADFRLLVHNFGVQIQNVFGRESVPRFDQDYDRINMKLMQAWGIGPALISGGDGGTYASSALNREFVTQMMLSFQNSLRRHILKRAEVIAEAQEHYDYEVKGALRIPQYREVVEEDEDGNERIVRRPKLLLPDVNFSTLNLRDEAQERAFLQQLKSMGVPISDQTLAVNIPFEPKQELERQANETVDKMMATARAMKEVQDRCDKEDLPYPADLAQYLDATLKLRQDKVMTEVQEAQGDLALLQSEMQEQALQQAAQEQGMAPEGGGGGMAGGGGADPQGGAPAPGGPQSMPPQAAGPQGPPGPPPPAGAAPTEIPRNRTRPPISDEQRATMPKGASRGSLAKFAKGPSSVGHASRATEADAERAVRRLATIATHHPRPRVADLVEDPEFYLATNMQSYEDQIRADFPEITAGRAEESHRVLLGMIEQYVEMFGEEPQWD